MLSIKYFLLSILLLFVTDIYSQWGCTDYQATNYDPSALYSDGSCTYPVTNLPLSVKCHVDSFQLAETSGIVNNNNSYWTHVDNSDNSIYRIDTASTNIFQQVILWNAYNQDWEDIASDANYIYVGDIGNNGGGRTNLRFYKVAKSAIHNSTTHVSAGVVNFTYSDQVVFNILNGNYYDCEAFFIFNDSIHMFTKGWSNLWTKHYVLPADTGTQVAQLVDSFNVNGVITSAAVQGDSLVVLLGLNYSGNLGSFVWAFTRFNGSDFFGGNKRRFEIGNLNTTGQSEAICFSGDKKGFITNEKLPATPAMIREFDLNPYLTAIPHPIATTAVINSNHILNACGDSTTVSVTIRNSTVPGGEDLIFSLSSLPVFAFSPQFNDTLSIGDSVTLSFTVFSGMMPAGSYTEDVIFITNDPFNVLLHIPITINIDNNLCLDYSVVSDMCNGTINFTSSYVNAPASYYWDFGDGSTSTDTNPSHFFPTNGNYTVTLIGCNGSECDTVTQNISAAFNGPVAASCYPQTQTYCCRSGINHFRLIGPTSDIINNSSNDASAGYEDFSCLTPGLMIPGDPYIIACTTGDSLIESLQLWIDLNNDGVFDPGTEELFSDTNPQFYVHTGQMIIPALPTNVYGMPLRLRIASDYQSALSPCQPPQYGQHEDYTIVLSFPTRVTEISKLNDLNVYPNPFTDETTIDYSLLNSSQVTLEIYNFIGEKVETLIHSEKQLAGKYSYKITGLTTGVYFVKLSVNGASSFERIVRAGNE